MKKLLLGALLMGFACSAMAGDYHRHHHHHGYWKNGVYVKVYPDYRYRDYYYSDRGYGPGWYDSRGYYHEYPYGRRHHRHHRHH